MRLAAAAASAAADAAADAAAAAADAAAARTCCPADDGDCDGDDVPDAGGVVEPPELALLDRRCCVEYWCSTRGLGRWRRMLCRSVSMSSTPRHAAAASGRDDDDATAGRPPMPAYTSAGAPDEPHASANDASKANRVHCSSTTRC